jgi:hypothetical protein
VKEQKKSGRPLTTGQATRFIKGKYAQAAQVINKKSLRPSKYVVKAPVFLDQMDKIAKAFGSHVLVRIHEKQGSMIIASQIPALCRWCVPKILLLKIDAVTDTHVIDARPFRCVLFVPMFAVALTRIFT